MIRARRVAFAVVLTGMVCFLVGIAGFKFVVRRWGRAVVLETAPTDPRSPFRGDYVRVRYRINSLPRRLYRGDPEPRRLPRNQPLHVLLERGDTVWRAIAVSPKPFGVPGENRAVIRGRFERVTGDRLELVYPNIQTYFIPEGTGQERNSPFRRSFRMEVAIGPGNRPVIKAPRFAEDTPPSGTPGS